MKKHYLIVGAVCFLGLAAGIYSCSHEMDPSITNETAVNRAALRARKFFESGAGSLSLPDTYCKENGVSPGTRASEARSLLSDAIEPDWLGARVWENEWVAITEIPARLTRPVNYTVLVEERGDTVSLTTQVPHTRIRFIENPETGLMFSYVITLLPDASYGGDLSLLGSNPVGSDYSGISIYSRSDGLPAWGWRYVEGEIENTLLFDTAEEYPASDVRIMMGFGSGPVTRALGTEDNPTEIGDVTVTANRPRTSVDPLIPPGWGLGGGAGGYDGGDNWTIPGGGYVGGSSGASAPYAKRLFFSSNMSDSNWKKLEEMIKEVLADCMGGALYNGLNARLGGGTLAIQINTGAKESSYGSSGITLNGFNSGTLFHEMFHAYQGSRGAAANREVEAYIAEYRYMEKRWDFYFGDESLSKKWKSDFGSIITTLSDHYISNKGALFNQNESDEFDYRFIRAMSQIRNEYIKNDKPAPSMETRSARENLKNLINLSKNC